MSDYSWEKALKTALDAQTALVPSTPQLDHAISHAKEKGLPNIAIARGQGALLSMICQLNNTKSILEIGTLAAYSTIWLATSVPGVKVTSIEYDPKHHEIAQENVKDLENVEIIHGAALDVLPKLAEKGETFDFIFVDADWQNQSKYFQWALKLVRSGGIIVCDNALREIMEPDHDPKDDVIAQAKQDPRVEATMVPVLNTVKSTLEEAIDGFVICRVK